MSLQDFLKRLLRKLEESQIPYMIAGSLSSSFYGQPRSTNDVDIVIDATAQQLQTFFHSLQDGYYVDLQEAQEALAHRTMFNIIDHQTGWKADIIIRKDRPFSVEEFRSVNHEEKIS